jgi:hypothetical protein
MKTIATFLLMAVICFIAPIKALSQEQQSKEQLEEKTVVYPVPAKSTEQITISFDAPVAVSSIFLVRADGWIPGGWSQSRQGQTQISLSLPKLSTGVYLLRFSLFDGRFFSKKIIVNK